MTQTHWPPAGGPTGPRPAARPRGQRGAAPQPAKPPAKRRGERGFVTSRLIVAVSAGLALILEVVSNWMLPHGSTPEALGHAEGFAALFLIIGTGWELLARHHYAVRNRGRTPARQHAASWAGRRWRAAWASRSSGGGDVWEWLPAEGPWLVTLVSRSGRPISGGRRCVPGEGEGLPTTQLFFAASDRDRSDLADLAAAAQADEDLTIHAKKAPWDVPPVPARPAPPPRPDDMHAAAAQAQGAPATNPDPVRPPAPPRRPGQAQRWSAAAAPVIRIPVAKGPVPREWQALADAIREFRPRNDGHLLDWLSGNVRGSGEVAGALVEVFEACVNQDGLTVVAMHALHDAGDGAAQLGEIFRDVMRQFADYYDGYRQWAADGGESPNDSRFITGRDSDET